MELTILIVLASGILAGVSPCSLPVYPVLLSSVSRQKGKIPATIVFCMGLVSSFVLFYLALGVVASLYGGEAAGTIDSLRSLLYIPAGIVVALYGFQGLLNKQLIPRPWFKQPVVPDFGYGGIFLKGMFFALLASSCNLPFLITGIIPALAESETFLEGFVYVNVFAAAMALPFLVVGLASSWALESLSAARKHYGKIELFLNLLLVVAGAYFIWTGMVLAS